MERKKMSDVRIDGKYHYAELAVDNESIDLSDLIDGHLGHFVCRHGKHERIHFPNEKGIDYLSKQGVAVPVYMLDHSGISVRTQPFNDEWDSWQWGWLVTTDTEIRSWYGMSADAPINVDAVISQLVAQVTMVDKYFSGDVWGYQVFHEEELVDSLWGIIGEDNAKELAKEAVTAADKEYEDREFPLLVATGTL